MYKFRIQQVHEKNVIINASINYNILFVAISFVFPFITNAAVTINEVAWPLTNFAIVLGGLFTIGLLFLTRTEESQNWCLGKMGTLVITVSIFFPWVSHAAVTINEIAWMGTINSANDEWIELYNDGSSELIDGWILSDGNALSITLSGTISGADYAVLERTDDTSASGSAFLIYTGALTNNGATLTLRNENGTLQDQVSGGENWENIGGDNATKETAQYTSDGWVTGNGTPGSVNVSIASPPIIKDDDEEKDVAISSLGTSNNNNKISLTHSGHILKLKIKGPTQAYVNQEVRFEVEPSGLGESILYGVKYWWNYGDTSTGGGKTPTKVYPYPGTYVVVVEGEISIHEGAARHEITILPVTFSITKNNNGDTQIHNDAKYEVDLSGYTLKTTNSTLDLPRNTLLVPNGTITIPYKKLGSNQYELLRLYDGENTQVAFYNGLTSVVDTDTSYNQLNNIAPVTTPSVTSVQFVSGAKTNTADTLEETKTTADGTNTEKAKMDAESQTAFVIDTVEENKWLNFGYIGFVLLIVLMIFVIYMRKPQ